MDNLLKVLLLKEGKFWVAVCLDYDFVAQGDSEDEAMARLCRTHHAHVVRCQEEGIEPLSDLQPAPKQYWDLFEKIAGQMKIHKDIRDMGYDPVCKVAVGHKGLKTEMAA